MSDLPTIELVEDAYYWVRHAYENPDRWTVTRWEAGAFWDLDGREFKPRTIQGPIPRPDEEGQSHG